MGENALAVLHPPILIQTVSKEGALIDTEDHVTWTFCVCDPSAPTCGLTHP